MEDLLSLAVEVGLKEGAKYAEARFQADKTKLYVLRNGVVEAVKFSEEAGISVRVLVEGGVGFSSTNRLESEAVRECAKKAVAMAKASSRLRRRPIEFSEEEFEEAKWEVREGKPFEDVPLEEKIALLADLDSLLSDEREVGVEVPFRWLKLEEQVVEKVFVNSEGARIRCRVPRLYFVSQTTLREAGRGTEQDSLDKGESAGWEAIERWSLEEVLKERVRNLGKVLREGTKPPKGKLDLVLGGEVVGLVVHESCGHPYEGDRILGREAAQAGESFVKPEMLGTKIGAECVTIVDDPTLERSYGHYLYDDEGVKARRRFLIKEGTINEFLQNRESAALFGVRSNAAARASRYNREPIVRMANTFMLPGDHDLEELVEGVKLGVYMKTFGEWNIDDRRFNMRFVGREAYLIEGGRITKPVRRPVLEVTSPGFYASVDAVGKDLEFSAGLCGKGDPPQIVPVWFGGPSVRLRSVPLVVP